MCWNCSYFQTPSFQRIVFNYSGIWLACKGEFSLFIYPSWNTGQKILCSLFSRAHFSAKCGACPLPRKVGELPPLTSSHQNTKALYTPKTSGREWASHLEWSRLLILWSRVDFIRWNNFSAPGSVPKGDLGTNRNEWPLDSHGRAIEVSLLIH